MTAQKKNQVLLLALFGLLTVNSSWVQDLLTGQPAAFLELSSNDGVQFSDCTETGDTKTCTARITTRAGARPTQSAGGRARPNNEATQPETREFTVTLQRNAPRPANLQGSANDVAGFVRQAAPGTGLQPTGILVTMEAADCTDCSRRSFFAGSTEQSAQSVTQTIRAFAQELTRRTQQEAQAQRTREANEDKVIACTHEYISDDINRGVRAISGDKERAECLANNLRNGDTGDLTNKQYFERHIRRFFETLARGGERGRQIAREYFQAWSAGDGGATDEMRAWADGWMGYTYYAQRLTDLARDAQSGRITQQQYRHFLDQEMEMAQMQFGAFGRQHGSSMSAEFNQRYRELQDVGRILLRDPRSGLARLEGDGRSVYGSGDRYNYDGRRLDALYGSTDRYDRRGDYGSTAYGSSYGRFAGVNRERVDMGRDFRLSSGRTSRTNTRDVRPNNNTRRTRNARDPRYDDRYSFNEGRRY